MLGIDFATVFIGFLVLLFSLTVHEAAHAWSADRLGDSTARMMGRLSLNPAVHAELIGTVVFPLIALTTHLPVIGWAKPVPVDVRQLHGNWRRKFMLIAAAGPASNLVLATLAALVLKVVAASDPSAAIAGPAIVFLQTAIYINVILAVFNMLPVPPLDGGNVLSGLLRGQAAYAFNRLRPYGFLVLYLLMLSGILGTIVMPAARLIWSLLL